MHSPEVVNKKALVIHRTASTEPGKGSVEAE